MSVLPYIRSHIVPATLAWLPDEMNSPAAIAMLVAIGWQESRFEARIQMGGPARGFWQFETGGVRAVLGPSQTREAVARTITSLGYPAMPTITPFFVYDVIGHNDVLAATCARLLLWNVPEPLPESHQMDEGWRQYLKAWNPGRPRPETWAEAWRIGWSR